MHYTVYTVTKIILSSPPKNRAFLRLERIQRYMSGGGCVYLVQKPDMHRCICFERLGFYADIQKIFGTVCRVLQEKMHIQDKKYNLLLFKLY